MTKSDKKMFSVRDVKVSDVDAFHTLKTALGVSAAQALSYLIGLSENKPQTGVDIDSLQTDLSKQGEELERLRAENQSLQSQLAEKITALDQANSKAVAKDNSFVFEPSPGLYANMRRCIAYLIRKGKLNKSDKDLPQQFTARALEYSIETEFENILKT